MSANAKRGQAEAPEIVIDRTGDCQESKTALF